MKLIDKITDSLSTRGAIAFIILSLFSSLIVLLIFFAKPEFINLLDLKLTDSMFRIRADVSPPGDVVVIAIDEKSVNELGRWPWKRGHIGELLYGLKDARVVALDMIFSESSETENDEALAQAIKANGNVVLGYFFRDDATEEPSEKSMEYLNDSKLSAIRFLGDATDLSEAELTPEYFANVFTGVETNIDLLHEGSLGVGSFNILPSIDGVLREANLIYGYGEEGIYPTLAIEALKAYYDDELLLTVAPYGIDSVAIGDKVIPLSESGAYTLNYYGPGSVTFTTYPAVDVIKGRISPETFKDKIIFVGATEIGIYDLRVTPIDPVYPGVEVHATIAGNVLQERFLIRDGTTAMLTVVLIFLIPLMLGYILSRVHRTYVALFVFSILFAVIVLTVYISFSSFSLLLNLIYPLLALSLSYLITEAYRNIVVEKKSKFYRKAFSTYVPPELVSEIIKNPESLKIGGTKKVISVLFSDIRGFTTISERLTPEELVSLLNEYLSPMTEIVFKERGMLDKYIGDAIMAIYNAPLDLDEHPRRACSTALNMLKALPALNRKWAKRDYPELKVGLGIHTGEAVVGNMGAALRFDYTAIGDTVNLAARLEGMTKLYGVKILVSQSTYQECKRSFIFRRLDFVKVKGKTKPVAIYELMGTNDSAGEYAELATLFKEALIDYSKGKFKTAQAGFEDILKQYPDDRPSQLFIDRCREFIVTPPPPGWDGSYVALSK
ncbi:MAG: adenylate/guanylate cyclase domain-containing protein [Deltaproteobacteria bacterium]|nr:adenylate/guanylate cyclase domain-containing protein [Deltaproteobacteria bacterium]